MGLTAAVLSLAALPLAAAPAQAQDAGYDPVKAATEGVMIGDPKAPITVIEYASIACSHCGHFDSEILPKIKAEFIDSGQVKLIFRDYPLNAPGLRAAMLVHCAGPEKGKALKSVYFKTQAKWLNQDFLQHLTQTAKLSGMSQPQIDACLANKPLEDAIIQSQMVAAEKYKVDSTPTFLINEGAGRVNGANEQELIDALVKAGAKRGKPAG